MTTFSGLGAYQSQVTIKVDKSYTNTYYGDDRTKYIAVYLCGGLKRCSEYTNLEERLNIQTILGDLSSSLDRYLSTYPPGDTSPAGTRAWSTVVASHTLSSAKCECLKQLILKNPFIIVLEDNACKSADGTTLLVHPITLKIDEARATALVGSNLALIKQRITQAEIKIFAVSQLGWNAIQETAAKYAYRNPSAQTNRESSSSCVIL